MNGVHPIPLFVAAGCIFAGIAVAAPVTFSRFEVSQTDGQSVRVVLAADGPVGSYVMRLATPVPEGTPVLPGFFLWRAKSDDRLYMMLRCEDVSADGPGYILDNGSLDEDTAKGIVRLTLDVSDWPDGAHEFVLAATNRPGPGPYLGDSRRLRIVMANHRIAGLQQGGGADWPLPIAPAPDAAAAGKPFHVTVDICDDIWRSRGWVTHRNVRTFMQQLARLGVTRVYWIENAESFLSRAALSDDAAGKGVLSVAVGAAHAAGLEIYALYKPFETGVAAMAVPPGTALPADHATADTLTGPCTVTSFVAAHPKWRLARRPGPSWSDRRVVTIKLVKADAKPTRIGLKDLEIRVSRTNGNFARYEGPVEFRDTLEERDGDPVRVLTLAGLEIQPELRYIMVYCTRQDGDPDFSNRTDRLLELYDADGTLIDCTWDEGIITRESLLSLLERFGSRRTGSFAVAPGYALPEGYGTSIEHSSFRFNTGQTARVRTLDGQSSPSDGQIVVATGKQATVAGSLHPVYPEVRRYWLEQVSRMVEAGVDGIDIRVTNHSAWTVEGEAYGFNAPAVAEFERRYGVDVRTQPFDREQWRRLQGEYYTRFLRDARALTRRADVKLQLHVNGLMGFDVPGWRRNNVPATFAWDWRRWIEDDLCDSVALKYIPWEFGAQAGTGIAFAEEVMRVANRHGKDVFSHVRLPWWFLVREQGQKTLRDRDVDLALAKMHWGLDSRLVHGVILYETASFLHMLPETGETVASPALEAVLAAARRGAWHLDAATLRNYVE